MEVHPVVAALFFWAGYAAVKIINKGILEIITNAGFCRKNFAGGETPTGAGILFLLGALAVLPVFPLIFNGDTIEKSEIFLLTLAVFTTLGLIDDYWGDGRYRGFKGHLKGLLAGRPTTGLVKAAAGGLMAVYVAILNSSHTVNFLMMPIDALSLALSVNAINLTDLRPGRAGKVFLAFGTVLSALYYARPEIYLILVIAGCLTAYLPLDLKGRAMMGDSGANALGAVVGLSVVWFFDPAAKIIYLIALGGIHIIAEKYSLTRIIESSRMLNYLDMLGRKQ